MSTHRFSIAVIEDILNRLLRIDPDSRRLLGELDGKIICLQYANETASSSTSPLNCYVLPFEGGVRLRTECTSDPDVTIVGNLPAFARPFLGEPPPGMLASAEMRIQGDIKLGQKFKAILDQVELEWEEAVSRYFGDTATYMLGNIVRGLRTWKREAKESLFKDFAEYLQEESRISPPQNDADVFFRGVDRLRSEVDLLTQRIDQLTNSSR